MQTKILKDRPTLCGRGRAKQKLGGDCHPLLPHAGYGHVCFAALLNHFSLFSVLRECWLRFLCQWRTWQFLARLSARAFEGGRVVKIAQQVSANFLPMSRLPEKWIREHLTKSNKFSGSCSQSPKLKRR